MRRPRYKPALGHPVYYHCVSRVVDRRLILGREEKEQLVHYMRVYERLLGLRVVAYCVMSNHFHILVEVPPRPSPDRLPDDAALVAHVKSSLGEGPGVELEWQLRHYRESGQPGVAEAVREKWFSRMWDVSSFMKVLKQRFSQWYNGRQKRKGTLWEERFRSVLVEGRGPALRAMAAYIDLNPVRAGVCSDPADYRWCGYAEALAGGRLAKASVAFLRRMGERIPAGGGEEGNDANEEERAAAGALLAWRCFLFGIPEQESRQAEELAKGAGARSFRRRVPRDKILEVLRQGGKLPLGDYLRCRLRYLTDGAVFGSRSFVEEAFERARERFPAGRKRGAQPVRGLVPEVADPEQRLSTWRALRVDVFG